MNSIDGTKRSQIEIGSPSKADSRDLDPVKNESEGIVTFELGGEGHLLGILTNIIENRTYGIGKWNGRNKLSVIVTLCEKKLCLK